MSKQFITAIFLGVAAAPAFAAGDCDRWSFARLPEEEGTAPFAFVCPVGDDHSLKLSCSADGAFYVSYYPRQGSAQRAEGYEGRFAIDIGDDTFRRAFMLQSMDNALVIDGQKATGPLVAAMQSGKQIAIRPEDGSADGDSFTLSGSTAALKSLASACKAVW
ncbi:MAG: hypothetical protein WAT70_09490 [Rhizobiaceae bacterium]